MYKDPNHNLANCKISRTSFTIYFFNVRMTFLLIRLSDSIPFSYAKPLSLHLELSFLRLYILCCVISLTKKPALFHYFLYFLEDFLVMIFIVITIIYFHPVIKVHIETDLKIDSLYTLTPSLKCNITVLITSNKQLFKPRCVILKHSKYNLSVRLKRLANERTHR